LEPGSVIPVGGCAAAGITDPGYKGAISKFNPHAMPWNCRNCGSLGLRCLSDPVPPQQPACPRRKIIRKNPSNEFSVCHGALSNAMKIKKE
jgi:hypothetical protein